MRRVHVYFLVTMVTLVLGVYGTLGALLLQRHHTEQQYAEEILMVPTQLVLPTLTPTDVPSATPTHTLTPSPTASATVPPSPTATTVPPSATTANQAAPDSGIQVLSTDMPASPTPLPNPDTAPIIVERDEAPLTLDESNDRPDLAQPQATFIPCGDVGALISALASKVAEIDLAANCTYTFTQVAFSNNYGSNSLPLIAHTVTINGNNAILERDTSAPKFRFFFVDWRGDLTLNDLTLRNGDPWSIASEGGGALQVRAGNATLNNVLLTGNYAYDGGAIYNIEGGQVTLNDSRVEGNSAFQNGGGIYNTGLGSILRLKGSDVLDNEAQNSQGGGIFVGGASSLFSDPIGADNTTIGQPGLGNRSSTFGFGGGIYADGSGTTLILNSTLVQANIASRGGGISVSGGAEATFANNSVIGGSTAGEGNTATDQGGGVYTQGNGSVFTLNATSFITGNSATNQGGGFANNGGAAGNILGGSVVDQNSATDGGGIFTSGWGTVLTVDAATLELNTASRDGGGLYATGGGEMSIVDSTIQDNISARDGAGIYHSGNQSEATMTDSTVSDNVATGNGGGLHNVGGARFDILASGTGCLIDNNSAAGAKGGGGIFNSSNNTVMIIELAQVSNNSASNAHGGGIYNEGNASLTITDTTIGGATSGNSAPNGFGGGIYNSGDFTALLMNGVTFTDNSADSGGALANLGKASVTGTLLTIGGTAPNTGNSATSDGGGIYNAAVDTQMLLQDSTIVGNTATDGAGLHNDDARLTVYRTEFSGNSATGKGGGLYVNYQNMPGDTAVYILNSTVSGNSPTGFYAEAGAASNNAPILLDHMTFSGNTSSLSVNGIKANVRATILDTGATNCTVTDPLSLGAGIFSFGYNIVGDTTCNFTQDGDQQNVNPLLGALADNGGLNKTHLPDILSPAGGNIPWEVCTIDEDQRGVYRQSGPDCDSGAVEFVEAYAILTSQPRPGSRILLEPDPGTPLDADIDIGEAGNKDLIVTNYALVGDAEITVSGTPTPFTIVDGSGSIETLTVTCNSNTPGAVYTATLTVEYDSPLEKATYTIRCEMNGLPDTPAIQTVGLYNLGSWLVGTNDSSPLPAETYYFGVQEAGWQPIVGDWDSNGLETAGLYKDGIWNLRVIVGSDVQEVNFIFGAQEAGWIPIAGDWNGDGNETVGLYKDGVFQLRNSLTSGGPDMVFVYGNREPGWLPIAGDWDGDHIDTIGLYKDGVFQLRNSNSGGAPDLTFIFGDVVAGWTPLAGDWDQDGSDTIGLYRAGLWLLRNSNDSGGADRSFLFGQDSGGLPVIGHYSNVPPAFSPFALDSTPVAPTPTQTNTPQPTVAPTETTTEESTPTAVPSSTPTAVPSSTPTTVPSSTPTTVPSSTPTTVPSSTPTMVPSSTPTAVPSSTPTTVPSSTPTMVPSSTPTVEVTAEVTQEP